MRVFTKNFSFLLLVFGLILSINIFPQAGSVELKDGGGVFISSHSSIQEAYNAIPATISQAYLIEILAAYAGTSEVFPITINSRTGSSPLNTITLRPGAGNTNEVITTAISGLPIFLLVGSQYFIVDGRPGGVGSVADLTIENSITSGTNSHTINFTNGSSNNTIMYCNSLNGTAGTAGPRNIQFGTTTSTGNNNNLIESCNIVGGRSGVAISGSAGIPNDGNSIKNNKIYDFGFAALWLLSNGSNTTFEGNEVYQTTGVNTTNPSGLNIAGSGSQGTTLISKNKIYDIRHTSTSTSASIRGITITPFRDAEYDVSNNFISLTLDNQSTASTYAIAVSGTVPFIASFDFNSIRIGGTQTAGTSGNVVSAGIVKTSSNDTSVYNQKNNIIVNNRTGGTTGVFHIGSFISNAAGTLGADYNVYYVDGSTTNYLAGWAGFVYDSLSAYKAAVAPQEQNTISKNIFFVSNTDLHLIAPSNGDVDLAGTPIPGITDDIDNELRDAVLPYRGADEGAQIPVELAAFTARVSGNSISLFWSTATETNNYGFEIERRTSPQSPPSKGGDDEVGGGWTNIGFVIGSGTTTEIKNYSFSDADLSAGTYNYRIRQIDFNGTFKYYNLAETLEIGVPEQFELSQNYPNPFNPTTTIKYSLAEQADVKLSVFNAVGEEITLLVNENKQAGNYDVEFDASKFSSGVYFYRLSAGNFVSVKKMIILK